MQSRLDEKWNVFVAVAGSTGAVDYWVWGGCALEWKNHGRFNRRYTMWQVVGNPMDGEQKISYEEKNKAEDVAADTDLQLHEFQAPNPHVKLAENCLQPRVDAVYSAAAYCDNTTTCRDSVTCIKDRLKTTID